MRRHESAILGRIQHVMASGRYILGPEVTGFESEFAAFLGIEHCVGVGSGTDAVALALRAVGIGPGDEVLTVSHSAVATVAAIELIGAIPAFVDIDPVTRCMDPARLAGSISRKTRAVVPVHIYGHPCDMRAIRTIADQYGLKVVEDCAQAHGASIDGRMVGTFGHAAAFSFYPTKNMTTGEGGIITTSDPKLADKAGMIRNHGQSQRSL
jgi:dTDP-4-amino-4,6-dideoxygalactose transaminase